jgi:hypothetical protein
MQVTMKNPFYPEDYDFKTLVDDIYEDALGNLVPRVS